MSSCPTFLAFSPLEVADFTGSPFCLFKWMEKSAKKLKLAKFGLNSDNAPEITPDQNGHKNRLICQS